MPELPEVETIRRGLAAAIVGRRIVGVRVLEARSFPGFDADPALADALIGSVISDVGRRGKLLLLFLDNGLCMAIHLRMTGQLVFRDAAKAASAAGAMVAASAADVTDATGTADGGEQKSGDFGGGYPSASLLHGLPDKTTRAIFELADGSRLYFNDQRKFGHIKLLDSDRLEEDEFIGRLGADPLDEAFTASVLASALPRGSRRSIKAVLLDQSVIAGVGNIYADESLHIARVNPARAVNTLTDSEIEALCVGIRHCLLQSIADGGSTMRNYVDGLGQRGEYLDLHARVFNRTGRPCPNCGRAIEKTRVAGRGTHWCSHCQS
jgi:formamidopyrimidine-DNA glycosylase